MNFWCSCVVRLRGGIAVGAGVVQAGAAHVECPVQGQEGSVDGGQGRQGECIKHVL